MIQVVFTAAVAVGLIFAALTRRYLRQEGNICGNRLVFPFNIFMVCYFSPLASFFLLNWPDREFLDFFVIVNHLLHEKNTVLCWVGSSLLVVGLGNLGFCLAHLWILKGRDLWVYMTILLAGSICIATLVSRRASIFTENQFWFGGDSYSAGYYLLSRTFPSWEAIMVYVVAAMVGLVLVIKRLSDLMDKASTLHRPNLERSYLNKYFL